MNTLRRRWAPLCALSLFSLLGCDGASDGTDGGAAGRSDARVPDGGSDASLFRDGGELRDGGDDAGPPDDRDGGSPGDRDGGPPDRDGGPAPEGLVATHGTYFGGAAWERAQSTYIDSAGFIYLAGQTHSPDFPATPGAYDTTKSGPAGGSSQLELSDGFVAKLSPDGARVVWATILGGSRRDTVYGVRTDSAGNVYVLGSTGSSDFPTTAGAYDTRYDGPTRTNALGDIFVASLSPDGSRLRFSTFVGGALSGEENPRGAIEIDETRGRIYVAGATSGNDFPTTAGAFQRTFGGNSDAVVFALSIDGSALLRATYLGGSGSDMAVTEIEQASDGSLYLVGATNSPDFPVTAGAYQASRRSGRADQPWWQDGDAFVARIGPELDRLIFATYFGGSAMDAASHNQGLALDAMGRPVFIGHTSSSDLPTTAGAFDRTLDGPSDGFVAVFSPEGGLVHASYVGGRMDDEVAGVSVGPGGRIHITGGTRSDDWPVTAGAHQARFAHGASAGNLSDAFLTIFDPTLSRLTYSSYLGGTGSVAWSERGRSTWVGADGRVLVAGTTDSRDFPIVGPSPQSRSAGDNDAFLVGFSPAAPRP